MQNYKQLEERLGYSFENKRLLIEALTHKSYKKPYNNERLEFLEGCGIGSDRGGVSLS